MLTHFKHLFWGPIQAIGPLRRFMNRLLTNVAIMKVKPRPYPLSTKFRYTAWESLNDRTYSARHLPPRDLPGLPPVDEVVKLFKRPAEGMRESSKSTTLFPEFAQWFTDGFLRTDWRDQLKNTSNHDIDLSNLYGLRFEHAHLLRSHVDGKLRSQTLNGEEYPAFYYKDGNSRNGLADPEFEKLPMTVILPILEKRVGRMPLDEKLFAVGGDRVNSAPGFLGMNVLFLREHNRVCEVLKREAGLTDDEQLFQTARNIMIVLLMKIVIEEYINHITPYNFKFRVQPAGFEDQRWYRQNWMAIEFNLLYRWHGLVRDSYRINGKDLTLPETVYNNGVVIDAGLGRLFEDASSQPAGRVGLFNTPDMLLPVEADSIALGRLAKLDTYNAYRTLCKFPKVTSFDQISEDSRVQEGLKELYGNVDRIEYYPGIFAEDDRPNSALPALIGRLVGVDAFSQALTNPLLAENIYNDLTFTKPGRKIVEATTTLSDIVHRNVPPGRKFHISMDRQPNGAGTATV
jgi:prostaglandin-endoperoxide synthase 2